MFAVEVRYATLNSHGRKRRQTRRSGGRGGGGEETGIKSNDPHLTGGEKVFMVTCDQCLFD